MTTHQLQAPGHPNRDVPDEFEPGTSPVEPDEGPVPIHDPDAPPPERIIDPVQSEPGRPTTAWVDRGVGCP